MPCSTSDDVAAALAKQEHAHRTRCLADLVLADALLALLTKLLTSSLRRYPVSRTIPVCSVFAIYANGNVMIVVMIRTRTSQGFVNVVSPIPTRMETGHWIASTIVRMMLPRRVTEIVDVVSLIPTRMEMGRPMASMSALTTILLFVPFVKAGIPMIVKAARGNTTKLGRNAVWGA